jgi:hypothetical protein
MPEPMTNPQIKLFYTKNETAALIHVCVRTLERMIRLGRFPEASFRVGESGKLLMWSYEDIIEWARSEKEPTRPAARAKAGAR